MGWEKSILLEICMTVLLDITFSGMEQSSYPPLIYLCVSFHAVWLPKKKSVLQPRPQPRVDPSLATSADCVCHFHSAHPHSAPSKTHRDLVVNSGFGLKNGTSSWYQGAMVRTHFLSFYCGGCTAYGNKAAGRCSGITPLPFWGEQRAAWHPSAPCACLVAKGWWWAPCTTACHHCVSVASRDFVLLEIHQLWLKMWIMEQKKGKGKKKCVFFF